MIPSRGLALLALAGFVGFAAPSLSATSGAPTRDGRPSPIVLAANADNPYGNVDKRNDKGNDTGDSQVDKLNAGQTNQNYKGPYTDRNVTTAPAPPSSSPAR